jgi:diacylglycerol kinase family enzyme
MPVLRRLAAFLALLTVAAMIVVGLVALLGQRSGLLAGVILLAAAAGAAWIAATERGVVRVLAIIGVAACVLGIALVLTLGTGGIIALVAIALLLAAFGACARYALGAPPRPGRRVGAAHQGVLIINPKSGGGKAEKFNLAAEAERRGIETIELTPGADLRALAEGAVREGADVIGMAGGDGSQAVVASVAAEHGLAHVCIPSGTRNHFALDLGLDRNDVVGALDAYEAGRERTIDLAEVNGRVFVNNASLGAYAEVVQSDAYREAKLRTWAAMGPDVLKRRDERPLRYRDPEGEPETDAVVVLVSNNPYRLVALSGAGTRTRVDRGTLGVATVRVRGAGDAAMLAALETAGRLERYAGFRQWEPGTLLVHAEGPVPVGVDGEALVLDPPLRFRSRPAAVRVRIPLHAPGTSPAARAVSLSADSLRRLLRTALGRGEAVAELPEPAPQTEDVAPLAERG